MLTADVLPHIFGATTWPKRDWSEVPRQDKAASLKDNVIGCTDIIYITVRMYAEQEYYIQFENGKSMGILRSIYACDSIAVLIVKPTKPDPHQEREMPSKHMNLHAFPFPLSSGPVPLFSESLGSSRRVLNCIRGSSETWASFGMPLISSRTLVSSSSL